MWENVLFSLIRSVLHQKPLSEDEKKLVTDEQLLAVLKAASKHSIAHLVALAAKNNGLLSEATRAKAEQAIYLAVYRSESLNYELPRACEALSEAEIPFIPLKGSVLQHDYPELWMRTNCDIDILVPEDRLQDAIACLEQKLGYVNKEQGSHDVSLYSPGGFHLELHYKLVEDGRAKTASAVLAEVWEHVSKKEGSSFHHVMTDEMFYFYHVAHMAKHVENGGCGVRPFIDLWILDRKSGINAEARDALLARGGLLNFADTVRRLSKAWFDGEATDDVLRQLESYVLFGGAYGNYVNHIVMQQQKRGGRMAYALSKIFLPYDQLKFHYPILQKHRFLMPFMQIRRWGKLVFCGHLKRVTGELNYNRSVSDEESDRAKNFLSDIGL